MTKDPCCAVISCIFRNKTCKHSSLFISTCPTILLERAIQSTTMWKSLEALPTFWRGGNPSDMGSAIGANRFQPTSRAMATHKSLHLDTDHGESLIYRTRDDLVSYKIPFGKLTVGPWQMGVGRLVSNRNSLFSGSMFIFQRVHSIIQCGPPQWCECWFRFAPITIDINTISHSYWSYKPTERYLGGLTL